MELNLSNKRALVTGGTRGIGKAIAQALRREGCRVVINGRDPERGALTALELSAVFIPGDVTKSQDCKNLLQESAQVLGGLDILVCNVGSGRSVPSGEENGEEWQRMLDLNLLSAAQMIVEAKELLRLSQGNILCISSICGLERVGAPATYAAAKAALNAYVKEMSFVFGKDKVRINAIAPGNILFPGSVWERKFETERAGVETMLQREVPLNRLGAPEEVADLAAFLVSERAAFITGSIHRVDGGQSRS